MTLLQQVPCPSRRRAAARSRRRVLALAVAAIVLLASGCGHDAEDSDESAQQGGRARVSEEGLVETLAALSAALEEGHRGDDAWERAAELGASDYSRTEIETFAGALRADADRWREIMEAIETRTTELRAEPDSTR